MQTETTNAPRLHSLPEAAYCLRVSVRTVQRLVQARQLESRHIGRRHLVTAESLERLVNGEAA